jgi:MFS transporter, DHA1 family, multidrug/chloramphenicol efflux transport protein
MFGSLAIGFASVPIIAWIGTSPLILMKHAKLSVIEYGLWQIPIFMSAILGNITMRYHTYKHSLAQLAAIGSFAIINSLLLTAILPIAFHSHYLAIIFGMCLYSFGLGFTSAPLNRLTLFSTIIPKGTASAMISALLMALTGLGNEFAGWIYNSQNNLYFATFCATCGILYYFCFYAMQHSRQLSEQLIREFQDSH